MVGACAQEASSYRVLGCSVAELSNRCYLAYLCTASLVYCRSVAAREGSQLCSSWLHCCSSCLVPGYCNMRLAVSLLLLGCKF